MAELSETLVQPRMPRGAAATLAVLAILLGLAALFAQQIPSWWPMATPEGMSSRASAEPGQYRTARMPYLREIMDALSPRHLRLSWFVSAHAFPTYFRKQTYRQDITK